MRYIIAINQTLDSLEKYIDNSKVNHALKNECLRLAEMELISVVKQFLSLNALLEGALSHFLQDRQFKEDFHKALVRYQKLLVRYHFASAYSLLDQYRIVEPSFRIIIYPKITNLLLTMARYYTEKCRAGLEKTDVYIDFGQDFSYLVRYYEQCTANYNPTQQSSHSGNLNLCELCERLQVTLNLNKMTMGASQQKPIYANYQFHQHFHFKPQPLNINPDSLAMYELCKCLETTLNLNTTTPSMDNSYFSW